MCGLVIATLTLWRMSKESNHGNISLFIAYELALPFRCVIVVSASGIMSHCARISMEAVHWLFGNRTLSALSEGGYLKHKMCAMHPLTSETVTVQKSETVLSICCNVSWMISVPEYASETSKWWPSAVNIFNVLTWHGNITVQSMSL